MRAAIVAACKTKSGKLGIGKDNQIPWYIPGDLAYFKETTMNSVVIMGRKTYESIGKPLSNRVNFVLSSTKKFEDDNITTFENFDILEEQIKWYERNNPETDIFFIGGSAIYERFLPTCEKIYLTHVHGNFSVDTYFPVISFQWRLDQHSSLKTYRGKNGDVITYRYLIYEFYDYDDEESNKIAPIYQQERIYINLAKKILKEGISRDDRTGTGTISIFGDQIRYDISKTVPLLTTKEVNPRIVIEELLWFLRGDTNAKVLQDKGIKIWDGNTSREFLDKLGFYDVPEGELRYGYGHQIRNSGPKHFDQLKYVENLLKTDPYSRRILWNLWNPSDLEDSVLLPCHTMLQFYVKEELEVSDCLRQSETETFEGNNYFPRTKRYLSAHLYMRSNDYFLGNPYNIFSYTVLIYILALKCDLLPSELIVSFGDLHIYSNHVNQITEQINRELRAAPMMTVNPSVKDKDYSEIKYSDFEIIGYFPDTAIKAKMAV